MWHVPGATASGSSCVVAAKNFVWANLFGVSRAARANVPQAVTRRVLDGRRVVCRSGVTRSLSARSAWTRSRVHARSGGRGVMSSPRCRRRHR